MTAPTTAPELAPVARGRAAARRVAGVRRLVPSAADLRRQRALLLLRRDQLLDRADPVRRRLQPHTDRVGQAFRLVTTGGWIAIAATVVGVWIGTTQGWQEYLVLGYTCLAVLAFAVAWTFGRSSFDVSFEMVSNRVAAGDTASGRVEIVNRARRSFLPARIELVVGQGTAFFTLPGLGRDESHEQLFDIPTRRRGIITVGPVSSVRTDPLHLMRRSQRWSDSVELYVHPRTVHLSNESTGFIRDIEGVTTQELSSNDVSFHALREYQPGDDRRAIHWRTTARTNTLMVRQFEETRRAHLLLVLATSPVDYPTEDDLEAAISAAGSLARHAHSEEREVSLYTGSGLLHARTSAVLLDQLAGLEPARVPLTLRELTRRAINAVPHASVCGIISGADAEPRDLRAAHKSLPGSVSAFALRFGSRTTLARTRIGDLTVVDVPDLASLPLAMRGVR